MRKLMMLLLALAPMVLWAQDNTWERPDEEEVEVKEKKGKFIKDQKYLQGAVPMVNGKVVFSKHINAPGKRAGQLYAIAKEYMEKMQKEKNQISSKFITTDSVNNQITGVYEEWLVFKKTAIVLDRTRFTYALEVACQDGGADIQISHIRYLYDEERQPQRFTAEEWISDKEAVNKKNTKLLPLSGKFRRKTIDRKDFLFNKFESLLNEH